MPHAPALISTPDRRALASVCLLVVVAMTLSAGLGGADWTKLARNSREQGPLQRTTAPAVTLREARPRAVQRMVPTDAVELASLRPITAFAAVTIARPADLLTADRLCTVREALLSLPPPALA